jgi:hypothetical protein
MRFRLLSKSGSSNRPALPSSGRTATQSDDPFKLVTSVHRCRLEAFINEGEQA